MKSTPSYLLTFAALSSLSSLSYAAEPISEPILNANIPAESVEQFPERMPDGRVMVVARLKTDPVSGSKEAVASEQEAFLARALNIPNTELIGRTQHVLNAVFIAVPEENYEELTRDPGVSHVVPVANYEIDLSETVPYIGASAVQSLGINGEGITVAVLDTGVDYLHAALGGSGSVEEFEANNPSVVEPDTFPTAKVIGGYDFVGPEWPEGPIAFDADPLDLDGHGTHVADIIAGENGVAPGASIYALQVCSSVTPSCEGAALILAMDFAADPNGDGDTSDHVDIINMSLGSNYGQPFDDDLSAAVENATRLGILTIASAGNGGDNPFIVGTPSAATSALSVAQTQVPSALQDLMVITAPEAAAGEYVAVRQAWSGPLTEAISGPIQYADGAGGNLNGCEPFEEGSLTGKIVMIDRGDCAFSDKTRNIEVAGGILAVIGLVAPGAPFGGSFAGGDPITIPSFMIFQADADYIRAGGAEVSFDPETALPLVGSMVSSSSRGPRVDNLLKPEIGAPGASISAQAGTGTGTSPFGGTSGAAPMVSGAAALLLSANPALEPWQVKAKLMNYADTQVAQDYTGVLASVSRIGAGEVNVNTAHAGTSLVYDPDTYQSKIEYGYVPVQRFKSISKVLVVQNDSPNAKHYDISTNFRFAEDEATGALSFFYPHGVVVPGNSSKEVHILAHVHAENLPNNQMNSGIGGNNPDNLTTNEFDGYVVFESSDDEVISVPWHMLPRKSARVLASNNLYFGGSDTAQAPLINVGGGTANIDVFSLLAVSESLPPAAPGEEVPVIDLKAVGIRTTQVPEGVCSENPSFTIELAFHLWQPNALLVPVTQRATFDFDQDGEIDYTFVNADLNRLTGAEGNSGQSLGLVIDAEGAGSAQFYATHATNSANTIITACAEQFGLTAEDFGTKEVSVSFSTSSAYFAPSLIIDQTAPVSLVLGADRYSAEVEDLEGFASTKMTVTDNNTNGPDLGILVLTNGDRGPENRGGATPGSEGLIMSPYGSSPFASNP